MSYEFFYRPAVSQSKEKADIHISQHFISVAGVFLGVAALIIVLSVMNGFEIELRDKILGINSHIVLMEYSGECKITNGLWRNSRAVDGIVASTPVYLWPGHAEK